MENEELMYAVLGEGTDLGNVWFNNFNNVAFGKNSPLTDKEKSVLKYHYIDHKTLREIGKIFNVTFERIRQIQENAKRKLRQKKNLYWIPSMVNNIVDLEMDNATLLRTIDEQNNLIKQNHFNEIIPESIKFKKISDINLSIRTRNTLIRGDIKYISDLTLKTRKELMQLRGMGQKSMDEIYEKILRPYNLKFKED